MNNQLVLGIILIVVGIALALLAYAFILNRRDQEKQQEVSPDVEAEPALAEEAPPEAGSPPPWIKPPVAAVGVPPAEEPPPVPGSPPPWIKSPVAAVEVPPPEPIAPAVEAPPPELPMPASPPPSARVPPATMPPAPSRRTLAVATLLRDEVSGKLLVLVGDREYANADELRASKDYPRVEYAAADLVQWLGASTLRERAAERAGREETKKPASMVEQINNILQDKLVQAFGSTRGIQLVEGPGGVLRIYFGLQSYSIEDIPDADVKRMMREAVAEWEAKQ